MMIPRALFKRILAGNFKIQVRNGALLWISV